MGEAGALAPAMRASDPLPSRLLTREVRALAALHRDDRVRAAAEVRRGLAELGSYQNGFGSLDLRTASAVHGLPLARLGLELAERNGSAAEFFAAVERGRAISIRLASVGPPRDERTADLLAALRQTEEEARGLEGDPAAGETLARLRARAGVPAARHPGPGLGARGRRRGGRARTAPGWRRPARRPGRPAPRS